MIDDYVPDVELEARCPLCDEVLVHDFYWMCAECLLMWEPDGTDGHPVESEEEFDSILDDLG